VELISQFNYVTFESFTTHYLRVWKSKSGRTFSGKTEK